VIQDRKLKIALCGIGGLFVLLSLIYEWDAFNIALGVAVRVTARIAALGMAAAFLYQSYDAFRSAVTGTEPKASAPDKNPSALPARLGGVAWGVVAFSISLVAIVLALSSWP
jgi:hypothetical protein